jgi:hypothetical protein
LISLRAVAPVPVTLHFRSCAGWLDPSPHPSLAANSAKQAGLWFLENFEFGILFCNTKLIQRSSLSFFNGSSGDVNPFHDSLFAYFFFLGA